LAAGASALGASSFLPQPSKVSAAAPATADKATVLKIERLVKSVMKIPLRMNRVAHEKNQKISH
jgi:hypothetical protein